MKAMGAIEQHRCKLVFEKCVPEFVGMVGTFYEQAPYEGDGVEHRTYRYTVTEVLGPKRIVAQREGRDPEKFSFRKNGTWVRMGDPKGWATLSLEG